MAGAARPLTSKLVAAVRLRASAQLPICETPCPKTPAIISVPTTAGRSDGPGCVFANAQNQDLGLGDELNPRCPPRSGPPVSFRPTSPRHRARPCSTPSSATTHRTDGNDLSLKSISLIPRTLARVKIRATSSRAYSWFLLWRHCSDNAAPALAHTFPIPWPSCPHPPWQCHGLAMLATINGVHGAPGLPRGWQKPGSGEPAPIPALRATGMKISLKHGLIGQARAAGRAHGQSRQCPHAEIQSALSQ